MPRSDDLLRGSYSGRPERLGALRVLALAAGALGAAVALFFIGEYLQRLAAYTEARSRDAIDGAVTLAEPFEDIALNAWLSLPRPLDDRGLLESGLPIYDLRIRANDLAVLQQTAERVLARDVAEGVERSYVPAEFLLEGVWTPIDVKLRGLYDRHYIKSRPSLRLKFRRDRLFEGKRRINLLDPYDKGLTIDVTTNAELARLGLLTWDSRFVVLRLNGEVVGLFQEIEQFGRSITDRNLRPEGYIFSGHGQLFGNEGPAYDKASAAIERFRACGALGGPRPGCDWEFVRSYFDTERWAWAAAAAAVLGSAHAWFGDNLRLFWDPARGRFEPIPWDYSCYALGPETPEGEPHLSGYARTLLDAPEFRRMRDERTWTLLTERVDAMIEHSEALFVELSDALEHDARHPTLGLDRARQTQYVETLRANRGLLMDLFGAHDLRVSFWPQASGLVLGLENRGKSFVRVREVRLRSGGEDVTVAFEDPVLVDGRWDGSPGRRTIAIDAAAGARPTGLTAANGVTGAEVARAEIRVAAGAGAAPTVAPPTAPAPLRIALANVEVSASNVTFGPGRVRLEESLAIPASHDVVLAPGLDLEMGDGVALLVYGDLTSVGRPEAPVEISGAEGWAGIAVQGTRTAPRRVHLEHTTVRGGNGAENERTYFTTPFAVHDGQVRIRTSRFLDSRAEDGINLKNCEVEIEGNEFSGAASDAVDCDFCTGSLVGNRLVAIGGDALDFSGSEVRVRENLVRHCGDKGISVGERTLATLVGNEIASCVTGIAVKDRSDVEIRDNRLYDLQVGIALYVKKQTFGPSRARVAGLELRDVATDFVRESDCVLELEGT